MPINTEDIGALRGLQVVDREGDKIGKVDEIYLDEQTGKPEWLAVNTGLFGSNVSFVPLAEATNEGDSVRVPYEKSQVKDAPNASADGQLSQEEESRLYRHYGMDYGESRSDSGLPEGGTGDPTPQGTPGVVGNDVSGRETDQAMTRSEEELRVGTQQREAGRARLRKWVETETVTQTVPVQREEVRVEREPITDANVGQAMDGPALSEEEHEVTLTQESAVAETEVVPVERIRVDKDVTTEQQQVSAELREEHIEVQRGEGKGETIA